MANSFDATDEDSWFFGQLDKERADVILNTANDGAFLIRNCQSGKGDYVLCVRQGSGVDHYLIKKVYSDRGELQFSIGPLLFPSITAMLNFYKTHYFDTTYLKYPALKEKVIAKYDFQGKDGKEDLPFQKGEILEIVCRDEEKIWTAKNRKGQIGKIPISYVTLHDGAVIILDKGVESVTISKPHSLSKSMHERKLPAKAQVIQNRFPRIYDPNQLWLHEGEIVNVLKINKNGQWDGEINGKKGTFPFTCVKFLDDEDR